MKLLKKQDGPLNNSKLGLFSKKEAASLIAAGYAHVHSSILGARDSLAAATLESLKHQEIANYPWEMNTSSCELYLTSSKLRKKTIENILTQLDLKTTSSMGDKIWTSLEELFTNSLFHAYHNSEGSEKYQRNEAVELLPQEKIKIRFHRDSNGFFIEVKDSGQGLNFEKIQSNFKRCYEQSDLSQIESKSSGAGLGLYVIFELTTHLKIVSHPLLGTSTSCWFANASSFDPDYFSFNFFKGVRKP